MRTNPVHSHHNPSCAVQTHLFRTNQHSCMVPTCTTGPVLPALLQPIPPAHECAAHQSCPSTYQPILCYLDPFCQNQPALMHGHQSPPAPLLLSFQRCCSRSFQPTIVLRTYPVPSTRSLPYTIQAHLRCWSCLSNAAAADLSCPHMCCAPTLSLQDAAYPKPSKPTCAAGPVFPALLQPLPPAHKTCCAPIPILFNKACALLSHPPASLALSFSLLLQPIPPAHECAAHLSCPSTHQPILCYPDPFCQNQPALMHGHQSPPAPLVLSFQCCCSRSLQPTNVLRTRGQKRLTRPTLTKGTTRAPHSSRLAGRPRKRPRPAQYTQQSTGQGWWFAAHLQSPMWQKWPALHAAVPFSTMVHVGRCLLLLLLLLLQCWWQPSSAELWPCQLLTPSHYPWKGQGSGDRLKAWRRLQHDDERLLSADCCDAWVTKPPPMLIMVMFSKTVVCSTFLGRDNKHPHKQPVRRERVSLDL
jgi:hypothetical protein